MAFQLSFCGGPEKGRTVDLKPGQTAVLGRGGCDVQVAHPARRACIAASRWGAIRSFSSTRGARGGRNSTATQSSSSGSSRGTCSSWARRKSALFREAKRKTHFPPAVPAGKKRRAQADVARQAGRHDDRPLHGRHRDRQRPFGRGVWPSTPNTTGPWHSRSCGPSCRKRAQGRPVRPRSKRCCRCSTRISSAFTAPASPTGIAGWRWNC